MNIELAALLAAIAAVESNTNDAAIGAAGERGRYQLTRVVWEKWMPPPTDAPDFSRLAAWFEVGPHTHELSRWVAERHIKYCIIPELEKAGRQVTVFAVASCWNAGVEGYLKHDRGSEYAWSVLTQYARREKGKNEIGRASCRERV